MVSNATNDLALLEYAEGATIEYSLAVLEEVRRLAVDGFVAFGHGGLEIGGVLYGTRDGERLSVQASAELPCEHALGPGFVLSENDGHALTRLLEPPPGLQALGWYRSHTRKGLEIDASDRELFNRLIANQKSIGLVVKPSRWGPSAATFYVCEKTGEIRPPLPREFTIEPRGPQPKDPIAPEPEPVIDAAPLPALVEQVVWAEPQIQMAPRRHRARNLITAGAALLGVAALAVYFWQKPPVKLALQAYAANYGQLQIDWNRRSQPVLDGVSGTLQIRDGGEEIDIPLDAKQLRVSSITYARKTGQVSVKLHIERTHGAAPVEEAVEFVGPAPSQAPVPATQVSPPIEPAAQHPAPQSVPPKRPVPVEAVVAQASEKPVAPKPRFQSSLPRSASAPSLATVLPAAPAGVTTPTAAALPSALTGFFPRVPPPAPAKPAAPTYTGPRSGRLIWTGDLGRRGVVEIEGARASIGSLTGSLSSVAADYRVSPAEFTREGLAVYTMDSATQGRAEAPSKASGWNSIHFLFDPVRAGELVVLEQPNRVNGFSRLVLRSDARTCPVIVIDWTVKDSAGPTSR